MGMAQLTLSDKFALSITSCRLQTISSGHQITVSVKRAYIMQSFEPFLTGKMKKNLITDS
jgi:hypothetical protein